MRRSSAVLIWLSNLLNFLIETICLSQIKLLKFRLNAFMLFFEGGDLVAQALDALFQFLRFGFQELGGGLGLSLTNLQILLQI